MAYNLTGKNLLKQLVEDAKEICVGNDVERVYGRFGAQELVV